MEAIKILSQKSNNLFQSDAWADFQAELKRKSWVVKGGNVQGLVLKYPLLKQNFLSGIDSRLPTSPRIPTTLKLCRTGRWTSRGNDKEGSGDNKAFDFRKMAKYAPMSQQFSPENTLVLDISQTEEKILAEMKPKWRYNISLANRKGIKVREGRNEKDIKIFYELTKEMEKRGGYKGHEYEYYQKMFEVLGVQSQKETRLRKGATDGQEGKSKKEKGFLDSSFQEVARNDNDGCVLKLFIAEYEGKPLAAILVSYFGQVATYLHGASGNEKRELMPTYALQWAAIREAKNMRCKVYDFWGVSPKDEKNHLWAGISRFKRGFGGEEIAFGGAYDLPFDKNYYKILSTANRFRKLLRR